MKLIAVLLLLISGATSAAPILIGKSQSGETYAKPEDVQVIEDGYRYISITNVTEGFAHSKGIPVGSIEFIYEIKCSIPLQRLVRAISFKNEWGAGNVLETAPTDGKWNRIDDGSIPGVMRKAFCVTMTK